MIYIERYTSPIESLISGSYGGSEGLGSSATAMGRFRVVVGAPCIDASMSTVPFDVVAEHLASTELETALDIAREETRSEILGQAAAGLNAATERLDEARATAEEALSADAVTLGVEIARQILKVKIADDDYDLEKIVRATLSASEIKRGECIVHLNPADADSLRDIVFRGDTTIQPDPSIPRGSVQMETPRGLLVRDPNAALDEICEQLLEDLV